MFTKNIENNQASRNIINTENICHEIGSVENFLASPNHEDNYRQRTDCVGRDASTLASSKTAGPRTRQKRKKKLVADSSVH